MKVEFKYQGETDKGRFDCGGIVGVVERNAREYQASLMEVVGGKEVGIAVGCSSKEVTGCCPNADCFYQLGDCFGRQSQPECMAIEPIVVELPTSTNSSSMV